VAGYIFNMNRRDFDSNIPPVPPDPPPPDRGRSGASDISAQFPSTVSEEDLSYDPDYYLPPLDEQVDEGRAYTRSWWRDSSPGAKLIFIMLPAMIIFFLSVQAYILVTTVRESNVTPTPDTRLTLTPRPTNTLPSIIIRSPLPTEQIVTLLPTVTQGTIPTVTPRPTPTPEPTPTLLPSPNPTPQNPSPTAQPTTTVPRPSTTPPANTTVTASTPSGISPASGSPAVTGTRPVTSPVLLTVSTPAAGTTSLATVTITRPVTTTLAATSPVVSPSPR
jgi:hypothetical protein